MERPEDLKSQLDSYFQNRDNQREATKLEKEQLNQMHKNPEENILAIQRKFASAIFEIQELLKSSAEFDKMYEKLEALKLEYTNSNYSMNMYDRQKYREKIESLDEEIGTAKAKSQPKKKFAFSSRPKSKPKASSGENGNIESNSNFTLEGLRFLKNEKIVEKGSKSSFEIKGNEGCTIEIQALANCLYISGNKDCVIKVGAVRNSVMIDDCHGCVFELLTHQLRVHKSRNCEFFLFASSKPIIEDCSELKFAKHRFVYTGHIEDLRNSGLEGKENLFDQVQDFNWLKTEKSPNFEIISSIE